MGFPVNPITLLFGGCFFGFNLSNLARIGGACFVDQPCCSQGHCTAHACGVRGIFHLILLLFQVLIITEMGFTVNCFMH